MFEKKEQKDLLPVIPAKAGIQRKTLGFRLKAGMTEMSQNIQNVCFLLQKAIIVALI